MNLKLKIDVSKIDKKRLFKGKKGTYLDAVLIETPNGQYSDFMIVESITKEERDAGMKGTIIGSGEYFKEQKEQSGVSVNGSPIEELNDGDLPF